MDYQNVLNLNGYDFGTGAIVLIVVLGIWELVWKGLGLWHASRNNHSGWFIAILIFNTVGILPILYIYVFSKKNKPA